MIKEEGKTEMKEKINSLSGITLIALVVTIVILIILATISVNIVMNGGLIDRSAKAKEVYEKEEGKEKNTLNNVEHGMASLANKKPKIEVLKCTYNKGSELVIKVMATDQDSATLIYKLYVGTTKDNLEEQAEIKKDIKQGQEVSWTMTGSEDKYYYKVEVLDEYAKIDSGIKETNNAPVLGGVTVAKDIDEKTGNWVKVTTSATDAENDKLTYTLKMWKKPEGTVDETEIIKGDPTRTATKKDITAGENVEITIKGLEEYQDYIYCVYVTDGNNVIVGDRKLVKTYCSGTGLECTEGATCEVCRGSGSHVPVKFSYSIYGSWDNKNFRCSHGNLKDISLIGDATCADCKRVIHYTDYIPSDNYSSLCCNPSCGCVGYWRNGYSPVLITGRIAHTCGKCNRKPEEQHAKLME